MQPRRFAAFLFDLFISILIIRSLLPESEKNSKKIWLNYSLLLPSVILYYNFEIAFIVRYLIRVVLFFLCFFSTRRFRNEQSIFYAMFSSIAFITVQNIFFSPMTMPIYKGNYPFTPDTAVNSVICLIIQWAVFVVLLYIIFHTTPLPYITHPDMPEWIMLAIVIISELYVKQSLRLVNENSPETVKELSLFSILLDIAVMAFFIFFERYVYSSRSLDELHMQEMLNRNYLASIESRKQSEDTLRSLHHDMKNHLIAIDRLSKEDDNSKVGIYVSQLLENMIPYENNVETGISVLDGLLSEKQGIAERNGILIDIQLNMQNAGFISDADICTLFGNALDNAIEACGKLGADTEKMIRIKSEIVAGQIIIYISNNYNESIRYSNGLPSTTKADSINHGIGLKNVRRTLEKYNGMLDIRTENNKFILTMLIPCQY